MPLQKLFQFLVICNGLKFLKGQKRKCLPTRLDWTMKIVHWKRLQLANCTFNNLQFCCMMFPNSDLVDMVSSDGEGLVREDSHLEQTGEVILCCRCSVNCATRNSKIQEYYISLRFSRTSSMV